MKRLRHALIPLLLGFSALVLSPGSARAGFMTGFTGNSQMTDGTTKGVVSFSVYHNTGPSNWLVDMNVDLGTALVPSVLPGGGVVDLTATYVYLYQIVNVATDTTTIQGLKISNVGYYTSASYFADKQIFKDVDGQVTSGTNYALGPQPVTDDVVDGVPSNSGVSFPTSSNTIVSATNAANTIDPSSSDLGSGGDGQGRVTFTFAPAILGAIGGSPDQWSSIVFLTSNVAPSYGAGWVRDGSFSDGDVPVAAPEPAALLMSLMGIAGLAGFYGWQRRQGLPPLGMP